MVIVETTVWVNHFNAVVDPQTAWLQEYGGKVEIGLTDLILCEVLQGIGDGFRFAKVKKELLRLPVLNSGGIHIALAAASNYRFLREKGITVRKTIDTLIATLCIEQHYDLLHHDRDYDPFEKHLGLKVVHP